MKRSNLEILISLSIWINISRKILPWLKNHSVMLMTLEPNLRKKWRLRQFKTILRSASLRKKSSRCKPWSSSRETNSKRLNKRTRDFKRQSKMEEPTMSHKTKASQTLFNRKTKSSINFIKMYKVWQRVDLETWRNSTRKSSNTTCRPKRLRIS